MLKKSRSQTKPRSSSHKADLDRRCCTKAQSILPRNDPSHWFDSHREPHRHGGPLYKGDVKHKGDTVGHMSSGEDVLLRDPMHGEDPVNNGGQHTHRGRIYTRCPMRTANPMCTGDPIHIGDPIHFGSCGREQPCDPHNAPIHLAGSTQGCAGPDPAAQHPERCGLQHQRGAEPQQGQITHSTFKQSHTAGPKKSEMTKLCSVGPGQGLVLGVHRGLGIPSCVHQHQGTAPSKARRGAVLRAAARSQPCVLASTSLLRERDESTRRLCKTKPTEFAVADSMRN